MTLEIRKARFRDGSNICQSASKIGCVIEYVEPHNCQKDRSS